jgi:hypothetical protein
MANPAMACPSRRFVVLAGVLALAACKRHQEAPPAPPPPIAPGEVPVTRAPIAIDGTLHERDWNTLARVAAFTAQGGEARPYSQIRLLRDDQMLYVGLYAADQDIRSSEAFELAIGTLTLSIDPLAHLSPPIAGARAAADVDETLDDPRDEDEEWVIEAAIPIAAVPSGATTIHARRCDTPKDGKQRCGSWDGPLALPRVMASSTLPPSR